MKLLKIEWPEKKCIVYRLTYSWISVLSFLLPTSDRISRKAFHGLLLLFWLQQDFSQAAVKSRSFSKNFQTSKLSPLMRIRMLRHQEDNCFSASSQRCSLSRNTSATPVLHSTVQQRRTSKAFARMATTPNYEVVRRMVQGSTLPPLQTFHWTTAMAGRRCC